MEDELTIYFYNTFSFEISKIKTTAQKNRILSQMEETFRETVRNKPSYRNELSRVYQELKMQCEKAS